MQPSTGNRGRSLKRQSVIEVCHESLNSACNRPQCRYAHPPSNVEIVDGMVQCCGDFLKGKCFRTRPPCRYFHPPPHLATSLLISSCSQLPVNAKQDVISTLNDAIANCNAVLQVALSASGSNGSKSDKVQVCRDFLRGICQRDSCKYAHPPPHVPLDSNNRVTSCIDFLNDRCVRENCRYFHPPPFLMKERCPNSVCKDFLRGLCDRNPCRFSHSTEMSNVDEKTRELMTCRDYVNGKCARAVCCFYHPPKASMQAADANEARPATATAGSVITSHHTEAVEICRDYLLGRCNRAVCCFKHPTDATVVTDKRMDVTCKDFVRGACHRKDCRYYHPQQSYVDEPPSLACGRLSMPSDHHTSTAGRKRGYEEEPFNANYYGYSRDISTVSQPSAALFDSPAVRSRGYADDSVNTNSDGSSRVISIDYSHSALPDIWESYYTPPKKPMVNYY